MLHLLTSLPESAWNQIIAWISAGGATALLTTALTVITTKARKRKIQLDAKDEQIEALIQQVIDLKGISYGLTELVSMLIQTSKGVPVEVKEKAGAMVDLMRKDFGLKIKESVVQAIALAKEKALAKKEEAIEKLEAVKADTATSLNGLKAIADEILSQKIT